MAPRSSGSWLRLPLAGLLMPGRLIQRHRDVRQPAMGVTRDWKFEGAGQDDAFERKRCNLAHGIGKQGQG